ncbi:MAG: folylpolyglutamate synthase/dihydrofolate synthase family protein [Polyangiales bacterium]
MAPSYADELAYLYGLSPRGVKLGLERVEEALALRGDPHRGLSVVHVAGTNGKGSVSATLETIARRSGLRTGLYTSPHLHRFVERIRIDGRPIGEREAARRIESLRTQPGLPPLTFFECATILAFEAFRDAKVELVVLEVGLGGRLDATNVIDPRVAAITQIGLEHQQWLGDTIPAIAREKAGIAKKDRPLVVGTREPTAVSAIVAHASAVGAPVRLRGREFDAVEHDGRLRFEGLGLALDDLALGLRGSHQVDNAVTALAVVAELRRSGFDLPEAAVRKGLAGVKWPARLERVPGRPALLLDAAHNPDGCAVLADHLRAMPRRGRTVLLFGAMADKDHEAMLRCFDGVVDARIYAVPSMGRAPDPAIFPSVRPGEVAADVSTGLARAKSLAGPGGLVVVAGSIFVVAAVRAEVLGLRSDPPIGM